MATGPDRTTKPHLIAIVGPTASGKTDLALRIAGKHPSEIICADSRTIYTGLDIGTAKPDSRERSRVPHYGLDLITPDESFSAAQFQRLARRLTDEIISRHRLPLVVGGTGLYVEGLLYDFEFDVPPDVAMRNELEALSLEELHARCRVAGIPLPENSLNKRYVIRALERRGVRAGRAKILPEDALLIGIDPGREQLRARIRSRAEQMFAGDSIVTEAIKAAEQYGWSAPGLTGNIYPLIRQMSAGEITHGQAIEQFVTLDWRLAKRQLTWWRRNQDVRWFDSTAAAYEYIDGML